MLAHKHITKIVAVITAIAVCLCLTAMVFAEQLTEAAGGAGVTMEYESKLFDTGKIISVNIIMDDAEWQDMLDNATAEEYYQCDVEVNGKMFYSVGIRPKGNTSLTSVAGDSTTDRYSFKLEFDQFIDGQTCYGLDKLVLNNNYADATNMKEALIYDMYAYLGADASLYNYAEISVNGEYWGVYLALEAVEDSFLLRNYGVVSGELYKPDSMDMGGGMGEGNRGNMDLENMDIGKFEGGSLEWGDTSFDLPTSSNADENILTEGTSPETGNVPSTGQRSDMGELPNGGDFDFSDISNMFGGGGKEGFSMGGSGANLNYTDDDLDSYSTIWDCEVTNTSESDHKRVVTALKNISEGTELETYMDIDNLLKYMAVHIFSVNDDSLSGSMAHNYYLYEEDGQLNIIPWDYNLSLGGMGMGGSDSATSVVNEPIDDAFSSTNFFDTLMENEEYHAQYYAYMQQLVDEYLLGDGFENFYNRVRSQIDTLVENDPNAFYSYEEYLTAVETLYEVVKLRGQSIDGQLSGTIPSTSSEQRNSDTLINASHIDLSVMGSMNMGGGGFGGGFDFTGSFAGNENADENTETESNIDGIAKEENGISPFDDVAKDFNSFSFNGTMPEGFDPSQFGGELPEGFDSSQFGGTIPEGFDPSQFGGSSQTGGTEDDASEIPSDSQNGGFSFDRNNMPGGFTGTSSSALGNNLLTYGICILVLIGALLFAKLYHRKPRKR